MSRDNENVYCHWCDKNLSGEKSGYIVFGCINRERYCEWCSKVEIQCDPLTSGRIGCNNIKNMCKGQRETIEKIKQEMIILTKIKEDYEEDIRKRIPTESELYLSHFMTTTEKILSLLQIEISKSENKKIP